MHTDKRIKVSLFLLEGIQSASGRLILPSPNAPSVGAVTYYREDGSITMTERLQLKSQEVGRHWCGHGRCRCPLAPIIHLSTSTHHTLGIKATPWAGMLRIMLHKTQRQMDSENRVQVYVPYCHAHSVIWCGDSNPHRPKSALAAPEKSP
eukprot:357395-Chlamydomonas_euryale.AAC.1